MDLDKISGEKIFCEFRRIGRIQVGKGTGMHKIQRARIWGMPARCWVEKPWIAVKC